MPTNFTLFLHLVSDTLGVDALANACHLDDAKVIRRRGDTSRLGRTIDTSAAGIQREAPLDDLLQALPAKLNAFDDVDNATLDVTLSFVTTSSLVHLHMPANVVNRLNQRGAHTTLSGVFLDGDEEPPTTLPSPTHTFTSDTDQFGVDVTALLQKTTGDVVIAVEGPHQAPT